MRNIIISGFSGCLKTSYFKKYGQFYYDIGYRYFDSDSKIMEKGYELFGSVDFNAFPRTLYRFYLMEMFKENTIFNRGIIDNLIFSMMSSEGLLEVPVEKTTVEFNKNHLRSFIKYMNEYDADRYLIVNNDPNIVDTILNTPNFKYSSRWDIYETPKQYFDLQKRYVELYDEYINNYKRIDLEPNTNYDQKLELMRGIING